MKTLIGIEVRGKHKKWGFTFYGDKKNIQEWRDDGLEVSEIENQIPVWVADYGVTRIWCFMQDILNFKNPWRRG